MILPDVNVLVYAHRSDADRHEEYRAWLEEAVAGPGPFGLSDLVLSRFLRIVTHPWIFVDPTPLSDALAFTQILVPDAWLAALAIESGMEWITTDGDFQSDDRWAGVQIRRPGPRFLGRYGKAGVSAPPWGRVS